MSGDYYSTSGDKYRLQNCSGISETAAAVLVACDDFDEPQWVPKSQIDEDSEVYAKDTEGTLIVSVWLARKKGWMK